MLSLEDALNEDENALTLYLSRHADEIIPPKQFITRGAFFDDRLGISLTLLAQCLKKEEHLNDDELISFLVKRNKQIELNFFICQKKTFTKEWTDYFASCYAVGQEGISIGFFNNMNANPSQEQMEEALCHEGGEFLQKVILARKDFKLSDALAEKILLSDQFGLPVKVEVLMGAASVSQEVMDFLFKNCRVDKTPGNLGFHRHSLGVVIALCSRQDFLPTDEDIAYGLKSKLASEFTHNMDRWKTLKEEAVLKSKYQQGRGFKQKAL